MRLKYILLISSLVFASCKKEKGPDIVPVPDKDLITYDHRHTVALSPSGQTLGYDYPATRKGKKVGIFYHIWHGAHGYDKPANSNEILPPSATDINSPFDISVLEKGYDNAQDVPYGPPFTMHHWGKPYFGYYVSNDEWIIRKHAYMLTSAGVDAIIIDMTNGYSYKSTFEKLLKIYKDLIRLRAAPPKVICMLNTAPERVMADILPYYKDTEYDRLWYIHEGKPLILAPQKTYGNGANAIFTFRYCWFDSQFGYSGANWYSPGMWTWGEMYPQRKLKEEMSVLAASHAHFYVGRSFSGPSPEDRGGHQPSSTTPQQRAAGVFFKQQFDRVLECDPDFVFVTGWNEFTAQRQVIGLGSPYFPRFMDKHGLKNGDTYFVDQYNHEFSRDIEPIADDFKDTYYYYLADYIRKYKGVEKTEAVNKPHDIKIDGDFMDWTAVGTRYQDFRGDILKRDHWGYGIKNRSLKNNTGRNDIIYTKAATDGVNLFFYAETAAELSPNTDPQWMQLFISIKGLSAPEWEGFNFAVNRQLKNSGHTFLQKCKGGWEWENIREISYAAKGQCLELAIPLRDLGIEKAEDFAIDFKWVDNSLGNGDIMECMSDGDCAPDSRFRYRYIFKK